MGEDESFSIGLRWGGGATRERRLILRMGCCEVKRSGPPVPVKSHTVVVPYPSGAVEQPAEVQKASLSAYVVARREDFEQDYQICIDPISPPT